jgi:sortase A
MTTTEKIRFIILRSLGNFLLLMSLYGVVATFGPVVLQEIRYRVDQAKGVKYVIATDYAHPSHPSTPSDSFSSILNNQKQRILIPKDTLFSILIPKVGASAKITANVDPTNDKEFKTVLQHSIAHAKGTVFPGIPGNTYLFAHSTDTFWNVGRYNAVFYLLKDLEVGDEVIVFFENKRFNYMVTNKYIADPSEVSLLVNSRGKEEQLILQTCWPPGTTWKRLFIVARPKSSKT